MNSLGGNTQIPSRLVYKQPFSAHDDLAALKIHARIHRVRTLFWVAERDPVSTPWCHIPLASDEVEAISNYIRNCPLPLEVSLGALWEALWMVDEKIVTWLPDNPFKTPGELAEALLASVESLLPALADTTKRCRDEGKLVPQIDLYNEFEVVHDPHPKEVLATYYPRALAACRAAGVRCTVSIIGPNTGDVTRPEAAYAFLESHGGLPDFLSSHNNGWWDEGVQVWSKPQIDFLKQRFGNLPVTVGEMDLWPLSSQAWSALALSGAEEILLWTY